MEERTGWSLTSLFFVSRLSTSKGASRASYAEMAPHQAFLLGPLQISKAMELLRSGVDVAVISLWLGHESIDTTMRNYLHGDMSIKERALARTAPRHTKPGRYRPPDRLLAFLDSL